MEQMERQVINAQIDSRPGSGAYMSSYAHAVNNVIANLPDDTKVEYMRLAEKWNRSDPPQDVKGRYSFCYCFSGSGIHVYYYRQAVKYAMSSAETFTQEMRRQYGAEVLTYVAFLNPKKHVRLSTLARPLILFCQVLCLPPFRHATTPWTSPDSFEAEWPTRHKKTMETFGIWATSRLCNYI